MGVRFTICEKSKEIKTKCDYRYYNHAIMLDLLLRVLHRNITLIIKRHFVLVSRKDSFKIIMALITHYDLELHWMNMKIIFFNGDLKKNVYMDQPMRVVYIYVKFSYVKFIFFILYVDDILLTYSDLVFYMRLISFFLKEHKHIKAISYASSIGSIMYSQICMIIHKLCSWNIRKTQE
ncbi:hypothetical protein CR513_56729, partial [Mucuna pruriens]